MKWGLNILIIVCIGFAGLYVQQIRAERAHLLVQQSKVRDADIKKLQKQNDFQLCIQIESIRQILRDTEVQRYKVLRTRLSLLRIRPTPEYFEVARSEHEDRMARLRRQNCTI